MLLKFSSNIKIIAAIVLYKKIYKKQNSLFDIIVFLLGNSMRNKLLKNHFDLSIVNAITVYLMSIQFENNKNTFISLFISYILNSKIKNGPVKKLFFSLTVPIIIGSFVYRYSEMPNYYKKFLIKCFNLDGEEFCQEKINKIKNKTLESTCEIFHPKEHSCIKASFNDIKNHIAVAHGTYFPIYFLFSLIKRKFLIKDYLRSCLFLTLLQSSCKIYSCITSSYIGTTSSIIAINLFMGGLTSISFESDNRTDVISKYIIYQLTNTFIKDVVDIEHQDILLSMMVYYSTKLKISPKIIDIIINDTYINLPLQKIRKTILI